jgi:hypothetical protein
VSDHERVVLAPPLVSPPEPAARPPAPTSLLWPHGRGDAWRVDDDTWRDLALDTLLDGAPAGSDRARLSEVWRDVPTDQATVAHRQDVLDDLERADVADALGRFTSAMDLAREHLATAARLRHPPQRQAWVLAGVTGYSRAVHGLRDDLAAAHVRSAGLTATLSYLRDHLASEPQRTRHARAEALTHEIDELSLVLRIRQDRVVVAVDAGELDAAAQITRTFARFRQRTVATKAGGRARSAWLSHVEEAIIDRAALLHPDLFERLAAYAAENARPVDPAVEVFDADARAFLAYRAVIAPLRDAGLPFCRPTHGPAGTLAVRGTFDLALADRLVGVGTRVVRNDVVLGPGERVIVVTGPNQGGKTTLGRTVGQLHLLAALGLTVPGSSARIAVPDRVVTLFERQEQVVDRVSMLERDLLRAATLLDRSTDRTVVVVNELFSSTATKDATVLGERVLRRLLAQRALTVYVTFIDELTALDPAVVSMVSTVDPADPATRTFRVVRKPADGRAYAIALATRYGLTRDQVRGRVRGER